MVHLFGLIQKIKKHCNFGQLLSVNNPEVTITVFKTSGTGDSMTGNILIAIISLYLQHYF